MSRKFSHTLLRMKEFQIALLEHPIAIWNSLTLQGVKGTMTSLHDCPAPAHTRILVVGLSLLPRSHNTSMLGCATAT